jgi:hypothetical protein
VITRISWDSIACLAGWATARSLSSGRPSHISDSRCVRVEREDSYGSVAAGPCQNAAIALPVRSSLSGLVVVACGGFRSRGRSVQSCRRERRQEWVYVALIQRRGGVLSCESLCGGFDRYVTELVFVSMSSLTVDSSSGVHLRCSRRSGCPIRCR